MQISDEAVLAEYVRKAIDTHPEMVAGYRKGKLTLKNALMGVAMGLSGGKANPVVLQKADGRGAGRIMAGRNYTIHVNRKRYAQHLPRRGLPTASVNSMSPAQRLPWRHRRWAVSRGALRKTLSFQGKEQPILIVAAGDGKIDNHRFKERFGVKAKMLASEEVPEKIGHAVGGVCPFAVNEGVEVYLMTRCAALRRCSPRAAAATAPLS